MLVWHHAFNGRMARFLGATQKLGSLNCLLHKTRCPACETGRGDRRKNKLRSRKSYSYLIFKKMVGLKSPARRRFFSLIEGWFLGGVMNRDRPSEQSGIQRFFLLGFSGLHKWMKRSNPFLYLSHSVESTKQPVR